MFAGDMAHNAIRAVAAGRITVTDMLQALRVTYGERVRLHMAEATTTPSEILRELANAPESAILHAVARNPTTPVAIRTRLLMQSTDVADRVECARQASADPTAAFRPPHPAITHLREVALVAVRGGTDVLWSDRPRTVYDLPGRDAVPWTIPRVVSALNGATLFVRDEALVVSVLDSSHELRNNATYMGNCTESYASDIAAANTAMLALRTTSGTTRYNVELRQENEQWVVGQVNSRYNAGASPEVVTAVQTFISAEVS
jgi:hypothetical protein